MAPRFRMYVQDVFRFADGRTVLVGPVIGGETVLIRPGTAELYVGDRVIATLRIEHEMIPGRTNAQEARELRAVSTRDDPRLTAEMLAQEKCRLEGNMGISGHRHLLGIDSPPPDYVSDDMTLGPRLPEGWDGDAWMRIDGAGYFLRAWNKGLARYAIGTGEKYEEARHALLAAIKAGGKQVVISVAETQGA